MHQQYFIWSICLQQTQALLSSPYSWITPPRDDHKDHLQPDKAGEGECQFYFSEAASISTPRQQSDSLSRMSFWTSETTWIFVAGASCLHIRKVSQTAAYRLFDMAHAARVTTHDYLTQSIRLVLRERLWGFKWLMGMQGRFGQRGFFKPNIHDLSWKGWINHRGLRIVHIIDHSSSITFIRGLLLFEDLIPVSL